MHSVEECRQFAREYRAMAAASQGKDKERLENMAVAWDARANRQEAEARKTAQEPS